MYIFVHRSSALTILMHIIWWTLSDSHTHYSNFFKHTQTNLDQFFITLPSLISHTSKMRISLLAVATNHYTVVELVLSKEPLRIVVAVDVDLCQGVVCGWFLHSIMDSRFQQWEQQFQPDEEFRIILVHNTQTFDYTKPASTCTEVLLCCSN